MPTYAVTGASGHLGRLAVQELLARDVHASDVVAVVRTRGKAADLAGRWVQVREADYSRPETLGAALAGVERLLLVSSSVAGQRAAHHANVIRAAKTAGTSRVVYTNMLNAGDSTSPLADEHRDSERVLGEAGVPFTVLRNGYYTEGYTGQIGEYLEAGEIVGAAGNGRISAAPRRDYAAAAAAALLEDEAGSRTYELGGPAFDLPELERIITEVTGAKVTYRDLPAGEYASWLQRTGLDEATAHFVAALDASIARGDLETSSQDLAQLLGRPATPLTDVVGAAHDAVPNGARDSREHLKCCTHRHGQPGRELTHHRPGKGAIMPITTSNTDRTAHLLALMKKGDDAFNSRDVAAMNAVHHPDMIAHIPGNAEPIRGRAAHAAAMAQFFHIFPDVHVDNDPYPIQFGSGDWITVISRTTGTFTGEMILPDGNVIAPTGKAFDVEFGQTVKWDGDQVTEIFAFWDSALQAQQVGLA